MTDHYEDEEETRERQLSNRKVLGFIATYWRRRPWLMAGTIVLTLIAVGFDLMLPWAAGRLVDAVAAGPGPPGRCSSASIWAFR
jgi:ATP-binding cassette subfamily B protein